jgi:hypothetical protein
MVSHSVERVLCVGLIESGDNLFDPSSGTIDRRRTNVPSGSPTLQKHLAETVNVIGMKMCQKNFIDIAR